MSLLYECQDKPQKQARSEESLMGSIKHPK